MAARRSDEGRLDPGLGTGTGTGFGRVDRAPTTTSGNLIKIGRRDIEKTGPSARTHGHGVAPPLTWPTFEEQAAS
ncbi:hypothetical protein GCM10010317_058610 [Streptomyces mirabilis]|uniref:hypothetical protein n=1 Tax=Streptomyces mirabilis TaxID=68239 RepID=UPI00167DE5F9|nr:hypothetical protein [Streptomyces mirabilis]GHD62792.1 hypothetical protein GCM10010317_058610 [Streptomyces mirabilis]